MSDNIQARIRKPVPDRNTLYWNAFERTTEKLVTATNEADKAKIEGIIRQMVFYGVKYINSLPRHEMTSAQHAMARFNLMEQIMVWMGELTYRDLTNLFPTTKEFDGHRTGLKDHFYAMDFLKTVDMDAPAGDPRSFLMEYYNRDIIEFSVRLFGVVDDFRRLQGQPTMAEEWAEKNGIRMFHMYDGPAGKRFTVDGNGRSKPVRQARPRHLRVLH